MNIKRACGRMLVLLCCYLLAMPAVAEKQLEAGVLLVATESITQSIFRESVVLLLRHDARATLGVVINKPSEMELRRLIPEHGLAESDAKLFLGGPVEPMMVSSLSLTRRGHPSMTPVLEDLYWTPGLNAMGHIITQLRGGERLRAYMGVSSWRPGQLQREIARGDWLLAEANTDDVLSAEPAGVWQRLYRKLSGRWI